jgi:hypothetical protein
MDDVAQPLLDFIKAHSDWAALVMFATAFGESFAFLSLLFPGTTVLVAAGTLLSAGTLPYASILIGAIFGAVLGDSVSYWLGRNFGGGIVECGRSRHPELLSRNPVLRTPWREERVYRPFFGPVRRCSARRRHHAMPRGRFWLANDLGPGLGADAAPVGDAVGEAGDR